MMSFKRNALFDDILHFIDEEKIVTHVDFDGSFTSYSETFTQKTSRSTENGFTIPDGVEIASAFLATFNITVLLISSIPLLSS